MHELGIVFHAIKTVERIGGEQGLSAVASVTMEFGEVSGVVHKEMTDCWDWAVKKSDLLKGSKLNIEVIRAVTHCDGCGCDYPTVAHGRTCPECGSENTYLVTGNEVNIKEIEAY